jgi:hypothetical protein
MGTWSPSQHPTRGCVEVGYARDADAATGSRDVGNRSSLISRGFWCRSDSAVFGVAARHRGDSLQLQCSSGKRGDVVHWRISPLHQWSRETYRQPRPSAHVYRALRLHKCLPGKSRSGLSRFIRFVGTLIVVMFSLLAAVITASTIKHARTRESASLILAAQRHLKRWMETYTATYQTSN